MTSYVTDGTVGPWAREKLECLDKYLSAYTTVLRKQARWCSGFIYVDAFAGAGHAQLRVPKATTTKSPQVLLGEAASPEPDPEQTTYIKGSPRVALDIMYPFTRYVFIEQDATRVSNLKALRSEYGASRHIDIFEGSATTELERVLLRDAKIDWKKFRAVVFLDPFGLQVPWLILERLAETKAIEVIVNFPVGTTIQRLLPRDGEISAQHRAKLDEYFGTTDWYDVVYVKSSGLFGDTRLKSDETGQDLAVWYRNRLKKLFGFSSGPRLILNTKGGHLLYRNGNRLTVATLASEG